MNFVQSAAIRGLRAAGFRVFPPYVPPPAGSVWVPRTGLPRAVFSVTTTHVTYGRGSTRAVVTLGTWHRWRTRARAKMQERKP